MTVRAEAGAPDYGVDKVGGAAAGRSLPFLAAFLAAAVLTAGGAVALCFALIRPDRPSSPMDLGFVLVPLILLAFAGLWYLVVRKLAQHGEALAAEARLAAHGSAGARVEVARFPEFGPVARVVNDLIGKLGTARAETERAVAASTAGIAEQTNRLAAILRDLHEGVVVCNQKHQVLLYNQSALSILKCTADLGLGRNLLQVLLADPIRHTLEQLALRVRTGRYREDAEGTTAQFVGGTVDGRTLLQGRMSLILQEAPGQPVPAITGYAVTFTDATRELHVLGRRDSLLREATEGLRPPLANLRVMLETLVDSPELSAEARLAFEREMVAACTLLTERLEHLSAEYRQAVSGSWPMSDIYSSNLISLVVLRIAARAGHTVTQTGLPQWLHGDSHSLVILLDFLIDQVHAATGATQFDLSAEATNRWVFIDVSWRSNRPLPSSEVDGWLDQPLAGTLGGLTVGDVLRHHQSELWSEVDRTGCARLRVPMPPALHPPEAAPRSVPAAARAEFFDFALLHQPLPTEKLKRTALADLSYVVFDCETTGLQPSEGDEIIALAAVRIVNRRILTGETFNALVNPGRPIRPESTAIHGITDDMVRDRPRAEIVLPQFHAFAADSVLVAHNAAFDLKFLRMKEAGCGIRFTNPILDTMLLSLMLQGESGDHTLDGIAARLGVRVVDRHTALGDSLLTAAILLRMLDLMQERGIYTLEDAMRGANILMELRARERQF